MSLKQYAMGLTVAAMAGFLGGAAVTWMTPNRIASAEAPVLPAIFHEGAEVLSPMGRYEIREVQGAWLRVKSLHPLAASDSENEWIYVPAVAGTWIPEDPSTRTR